MRALIAAVIGIIAYANAAVAADGDACAVASHLVQADVGMPYVAAAIGKTKILTVVVIGTTSSTLPGPSGASLAYPARLEAALQKKLPGVDLKVIAYPKPRRSAADMAGEFARILKDDKPALVVWQTGTLDAIRGVDPEEFRVTLDEGVDTLQTEGADVVFMNMQFSPRTDAMIAAPPYAEVMRFVAQQRNVNLFDRLAIMRHWNELGTFDLNADTKSLDMAARVHDCIGRLLADLVVEGAKMSETETKDPR